MNVSSSADFVPKTGNVTLYPTPTPHSRPRRTMLDPQGHLWFAEFAANKLAMFDIKQETFQEWDVPTPFTYPYDVFLDKNNELWAGSMSNDRILRFTPATGKGIDALKFAMAERVLKTATV